MHCWLPRVATSRHQPLGDHHEHVFQRRLLFGEADQAAVGGGELAQQPLDVGVFALDFERATAVIQLHVADFRVAADQADARLGVAGEADFDRGGCAESGGRPFRSARAAAVGRAR